MRCGDRRRFGCDPLRLERVHARRKLLYNALEMPVSDLELFDPAAHAQPDSCEHEGSEYSQDQDVPNHGLRQRITLRES